MYLVLLRFSSNHGSAREHLPGHDEWIRRGFDDGVFLMVGGLQPKLGGVVLAHRTSREELEARLRQDPFVAHDVVRAELLELTPARAEPRLAFLLA